MRRAQPSRSRPQLRVEQLEARDVPSAVADYVPGELLVSFRPGVGQAEINDFYADYGLTEREALDRYARIDTARLKLVAVPAERTAELVTVLGHDSRVAFAEPNYDLSGAATASTPTDPLYTAQQHLNNAGQWGGTPNADINASEAWKITTGSPDVLIAVLDTGVDYTHPELVANMWTNPFETAGDGIDNDANGYIDDIHGISAVNGSGDPMDNGALGGHGTGVAGIIGAAPFDEGTVGVAWRVGIIAVEVVTPNNNMRADNLIRAFQYVNYLKNVEHQNIVATNNSYVFVFGAAKSRAVRDAMAGLDQPGMAPILHVAAAGNDNADNDSIPLFPAAYDLPNVITVAATDQDDRYADFSNYGAVSVDLAAPGAFGITSLEPDGRYDFTFNGTSAAAPLVTGAAALVWSAFPNLTAAQVKQRILDGVDPIGQIGDNALKPTLTNGRLNIANALAGASPSRDHTAPSAVGNLTATAADFQSVTLTWNAPGDDGSAGRAGFYDLRYSKAPITSANWGDAVRVLGEIGPKASGGRERFTVTGLDPDTRYYFALRARDDMGNESGLSNGAHTTTARAKTLYSDDRDGLAGWSATGLWHRSDLRAGGNGTSWYYGDETTRTYDTGAANTGTLTSPKFDLTDASHPVLVYSEWREVEDIPLDDSAIVQVKTIGGKWETVSRSEFSTAVDPLNWQYRAAALGFNLSVASEFDDPRWVSRAVDLSEFAGQTLRVRFVFDTADEFFNDFEGWYIRNVRVYDELVSSPHGHGRESVAREVVGTGVEESGGAAASGPGVRFGLGRSDVGLGSVFGGTNSIYREGFAPPEAFTGFNRVAAGNPVEHPAEVPVFAAREQRTGERARVSEGADERTRAARVLELSISGLGSLSGSDDRPNDERWELPGGDRSSRG